MTVELPAPDHGVHYTEQQMLDYGTAMRREALEEAAKVCLKNYREESPDCEDYETGTEYELIKELSND